MYLRYRQALSGACNPSATITRAGFTAILTRHTRYRRTLTSLFALAFVLCALPGCGINRFPTLDEQVKAAWSEVLNQYQRRADLIPNLVQTVKGYAHQEQQVLTQVVEARAKATQMQLPGDVLSNPASVPSVRAEPGGAGRCARRLLAVSENYPDLKSNENFLALQSQLEGTENRIAVARRDYILAVQEYNTALRSYPGRWLAAWFYPELKVRETFTITEQAQQVPKVNF
jgi:LemA protein